MKNSACGHVCVLLKVYRMFQKSRTKCKQYVQGVETIKKVSVDVGLKLLINKSYANVS